MINKRFFNFKRYDTFIQQQAQIPDDAIVFIQDRPSIYTHGTEYMCNGTKETVLSQNSLEFKDSTGKTIFKLYIGDDGIIRLTDSSGDEIQQEYALVSYVNQQDAILDEKIRGLNTKITNNVTDISGIKNDINGIRNGIEDAFGINAEGISAIKAILSDEDTTTGILKEIASKADQSDVNTALTNINTTLASKANRDELFSGSYNDLTDKPTISTVPTNVSAFNNDVPYLTGQDITGKADASDVETTFNTLRAQIQAAADEDDLRYMARVLSDMLTAIQNVISENYILKKDAYSNESGIQQSDWSEEEISEIDPDSFVVNHRTLYTTSNIEQPEGDMITFEGNRFQTEDQQLNTDPVEGDLFYYTEPATE